MFPRSFLLAALAALVCTTAASPASSIVPKGFVTAKGQQFQLDGKPFAFIGANSYWAPLLLTQKDVDYTFKEMKNAGVKVLRTWGFNAITEEELADAKKSGLTYYQLWDSKLKDWVLNPGPQGLQRLDNVIRTAAKYDIKLILNFSNNWVGYGGAELYVKYMAGANATHDEFFLNESINKSFERYVATIVSRYRNSPTIFAWELLNEARCNGDLPTSDKCPQKGVITSWYQRHSKFIKSLDPFHMVTTGGEGHFFWKEAPAPYTNDYNYNGQAGEDFDGELKLDSIDFVTYHIYPQYWYANLDYPGSSWNAKDWGVEWIQQHADAAKKANKPVVLEEFGMTGLENKTEIFPAWVQRALDTHHAGIMPWQFGVLDLKESNGNRLIKYADAIIDGASPNDGHTYYKNQTEVWKIFTDAAKVQNSRSK